MIEKESWQRLRDKELQVFGIGVKENSDQASSWAQQYGLTYPLVADREGEIYKKYGTGSVPYHVVIGKDFVIRHSEERFDGTRLFQLLNACLQEKI